MIKFFENNIYSGKKVLVTGHTGFKGSWLSLWLKEFGAEVFGLSKDIPTDPSHFKLLNIEKDISHHIFDIKDRDQLNLLIEKVAPDFIFHLAAQPLVKQSYVDPHETISTNVMGLNNLLDALRNLKKKCAAVLITSDKCYDNIEIERGYHEEDILGGKDPYSASKGAAELVFKGYYHSFFKNQSDIRIATARAGNVIGGGDWGNYRIIPDCIRAWNNDQNVKIRNPDSTRPWQHVLEPLSGYLQLGHCLWEDTNFNGESYNFGPREGENYSVIELIKKISFRYFDNPFSKYETNCESSFHEASLLSLDCRKAKTELNWSQTLTFDKTCKFTADWYKLYHLDNCYEFSVSQINEFINIVKLKNSK